jgi:hypothetical protein
VGALPNPPGTGEALASISGEYDSTHIDWQGVLSGNYTPDFTGSLPATCSGASCAYNSYFVNGDVDVPAGTRRMLLIATGNVRLDSGAHVDGIILAGGRLLAYGGAGYTFTVHGMVVTGLNCGVGACPTTQDSIGRTGTLEWSWCYTHAPIGDLNRLTPMKNTWVDQWSLY